MLDHQLEEEAIERQAARFGQAADAMGDGDAADAGHVAAAVELVLEGLHLTRRIDKTTVDGRTVYGA
jgi:hypothetical protein